MVQAARVREVRPINGKLVVRIELALERVVGGPDVARGALQDVHSFHEVTSVEGSGNSGDGSKSSPVVDRRTVKVAIHALKRRRTVVVWIRREDDIPQPVDQVNLGRPEICAVRLAGRGQEEELLVGVVPVSATFQPSVIHVPHI